MKLVGKISLFAVFGLATSASAIVISGGPSTAPFGGGTCSVTTQATCNGSPCSAPDGTGGVTMTCSGLNLAASGLRHLYYGINNAPAAGNGPNGDSMQGATPAGTEIFRFSSITGSNQINYSGTTSLYNAQTNTLSSVGESNALVFQAGTGSLITDSTITGLNNANGDVHYLWQVGSNSFTTTVNVRAGGGNALPTVFNPTHTAIGTQEIDHVNLAFYWDTCGNGIIEGAEQCDDGAGNGTVADCCDANCRLQPSSTVCRPPAGPCDLAESCTGSSTVCPADVLAPSTVTCRSSAGACDTAEKCTGSSAACPADGFAASTVTCRPSVGVCDTPDNCTGSSAACPADALEPSTTVCRSAAGACDVAESCTGADASCPPDALAPSSTTCRPVAGPCDLPESCTGSSPSCPSDSVAGAFVECRPAAGSCDVAENCDGTNVACPPDAFRPSSTVCRSSGGACDVAESCPGTGASCPADAKQPSGTTCRASAGTCDIAETCDGASNGCPADALVPVGTVCRSAAGSCDVAEACTGLSAACPPNVFVPDATPCDDGNACTANDACQAGACQGTPLLNGCADHYLCYKISAASAPIPDVHLVDEFEDIHAAVRKVKNLCTPADKNGEGVIDDVTHLQSYTIKALSGTPSFVRRTNLGIQNQFGTLHVDAYKRDLLFVPVNKSLSGPTAPPNYNAINVDHYKCYKVKTTAGTTRFTPTSVTVADQFTSPAKFLTLKKIKHLCTPVDKNGEGIKNSAVHLACYQAKVGSGQPKHVRRTGVNTNGQLGAVVLSTLKENELCVPTLSVP